MLDFKKLSDGIIENKDRAQEYFMEFFTKENFKEYQIDEPLSANQVKAIRTMFESKKRLNERCEKSFSYDPLCIEAFFVYYFITEDVFLNFRFKSYYEKIGDFPDLSSYQKDCFLKILDLYSEFLLDIRNFTTGIKVEKQILKLGGMNRRGLNRLCYMYCMIEDADEFYRLYLDQDFDAYDYMLLLVTLLKHEDTIRAKEVYEDMMKNIPYADHLDHLWDLDENDEKQQSFYQTVEDAYEHINSVPEFFTFINQVREKAV